MKKTGIRRIEVEMKSVPVVVGVRRNIYEKLDEKNPRQHYIIRRAFTIHTSTHCSGAEGEIG